MMFLLPKSRKLRRVTDAAPFQVLKLAGYLTNVFVSAQNVQEDYASRQTKEKNNFFIRHVHKMFIILDVLVVCSL
eukprot:Skav204019  [mRNA]  locus=scaffold229:32108:32332:- [translate_table: standard]